MQNRLRSAVIGRAERIALAQKPKPALCSGAISPSLMTQMSQSTACSEVACGFVRAELDRVFER